MKVLLISVLCLFIFTACSQKILITATKPALIDRASKTKRIAVLQFANDDKVSLGAKIEANLYDIKINNKPYFTIISKNRDDILKEQKFQYSALANKENSTQIGELLGAQALITGKIDIADTKEDYTTAQSYRCGDPKCTYKVIEYTQCTNVRYTLKATISMIDVQKGDIMYTNNYTEIANHKTCLNKIFRNQGIWGDLPPESEVFDDLANKILKKFLPNISPTIETFYIKVFEDPEIKYTKEQKQILENALAYLKYDNLDKAEELFSELLNSTNDKCYLAAYNLGSIKEAKGEYENAKELYELADDLTNKPNDTIFQAIIRINTQIKNYKKLQSS